MPQLNEEGRFKAQVVAHGLDRKENSKVVQFGFQVRVVQMWNGTEWIEDTRGLEITDSQNIIKKDGELNEVGFNSVKNSMGWDGLKFEVLNGVDFEGMTVQIETGYETYQPRDKNGTPKGDPVTSLKVKRLSSENYSGHSIKTLDAATIRNLDAQYGAKLRALSGGAKAKPVAKSKSQPMAPPADPLDEDLSIPPELIPSEPPAPEPPAPKAKPATRNDAWAAVYKACKGRNADAELEWHRLNAEHKDNWAKIIESASIPF